MDLQKSPWGLLGALGLKVTGRNPPLFSDAVIPVVDVYDQYLAQGELKGVSASVNLSLAQSTGQNLFVPNGKVWRVLGAGGSTGLAGADAAIVSTADISINNYNLGVAFPIVYAFAHNAMGTGPRAFGTWFSRPIFLPAGWGLAFHLSFSANITVAQPFFVEAFVQEFDQ